MQWSGHRTLSMLLRYAIITLEELRRAGKKASDYCGPKNNVRPLRGDGSVTDPQEARSLRSQS